MKNIRNLSTVIVIAVLLSSRSQAISFSSIGVQKPEQSKPTVTSTLTDNSGPRGLATGPRVIKPEEHVVEKPEGTSEKPGKVNAIENQVQYCSVEKRPLPNGENNYGVLRQACHFAKNKFKTDLTLTSQLVDEISKPAVFSKPMACVSGVELDAASARSSFEKQIYWQIREACKTAIRIGLAGPVQIKNGDVIDKMVSVNDDVVNTFLQRLKGAVNCTQMKVHDVYQK